jgi:hypothetical protein
VVQENDTLPAWFVCVIARFFNVGGVYRFVNKWLERYVKKQKTLKNALFFSKSVLK